MCRSGHHLVVDAAGPLVDDQQRDVVLAQLAGDRAEDGVAGDRRVEELVRLLDGDHQRGGSPPSRADHRSFLLDVRDGCAASGSWPPGCRRRGPLP